MTTPYARSGTYGAAFGPVGSTGGISQTLATVAGTLYTLSYDLRNLSSSSTAYFSVSAGASNLLTIPSALSFGYTHITQTFLATSNSTVLSFSFRQDPSYWGLDNVSVAGLSSAPVTSVPGPIAGAGLPALFGLMGLGLWRRKRAVKA